MRRRPRRRPTHYRPDSGSGADMCTSYGWRHKSCAWQRRWQLHGLYVLPLMCITRHFHASPRHTCMHMAAAQRARPGRKLSGVAAGAAIIFQPEWQRRRRLPCSVVAVLVNQSATTCLLHGRPPIHRFISCFFFVTATSFHCRPATPLLSLRVRELFRRFKAAGETVA